MDELDNIGTDGCKEYSRKWGGGGLLSGKGKDGNYRACGHDEIFSICVPQMRAG